MSPFCPLGLGVCSGWGLLAHGGGVGVAALLSWRPVSRLQGSGGWLQNEGDGVLPALRGPQRRMCGLRAGVPRPYPVAPHPA